jgi:hypothetical protein
MNAGLKYRIKGWLALFVSVVAVVCLLVVLGTAAIFYMTSSDCANETGLELAQSNGRWKAVLVDRECGTNTEFRAVSIIPITKKLPDNASKVFVIDDNDGRSYMRVELEWIDNNTLQILYSEKSRIFTQKQQFNDVTIQYTTFEKLIERRYRGY